MKPEIFMNVKINDKQKSDDRTIENQASDDWLLRKINSWRTVRRSLLTKFFADENFLLYSSTSNHQGPDVWPLQVPVEFCLYLFSFPLSFSFSSTKTKTLLGCKGNNINASEEIFLSFHTTRLRDQYTVWPALSRPSALPTKYVKL